jgi:hypothetical protein
MGLPISLYKVISDGIDRFSASNFSKFLEFVLSSGYLVEVKGASFPEHFVNIMLR